MFFIGNGYQSKSVSRKALHPFYGIVEKRIRTGRFGKRGSEKNIKRTEKVEKVEKVGEIGCEVGVSSSVDRNWLCSHSVSCKSESRSQPFPDRI